jgi:hypothetical protein
MANTNRPGGNQPEQAGSGNIHFASDVVKRAEDAAASAAGQAKTAASALAEKAQETASNVAHKAQETAANLGHKAEGAKTSVGDQMKSLAGNIREKAPDTGMTGRAASAVAGGLEAGGSYLQQHSFGDMAEDMTNLIRRHPIQAVLIGIGVGFLLAKATRS